MNCYEHKWEKNQERHQWVCEDCGVVAESTDMIYTPCVLCGKAGANRAGLCPEHRERAALITEVERAACSLLYTLVGVIRNPEVDDYVRHLLADPDYSEPFSCEIRHNDREMYPPENGDLFYMLDKAAYYLAVSIAGYRADGRPTGDQSTEIGGGFRITSSLAANIVEFHQAVLNAHCTNADHREGRLRHKIHKAQANLA